MSSELEHKGDSEKKVSVSILKLNEAKPGDEISIARHLIQYDRVEYFIVESVSKSGKSIKVNACKQPFSRGDEIKELTWRSKNQTWMPRGVTKEMTRGSPLSVLKGHYISTKRSELMW